MINVQLLTSNLKYLERSNNENPLIIFYQNTPFLSKTWRKPGANLERLRLRLRLRISFRGSQSQPQSQPIRLKQNKMQRKALLR
jgi:hypothetical protein